MARYLHEFQSDADFQAFIESEAYIEPFVSSTDLGNDECRVDYNQRQPEPKMETLLMAK